MRGFQGLFQGSFPSQHVALLFFATLGYTLGSVEFFFQSDALEDLLELQPTRSGSENTSNAPQTLP